jgi:hypothetical protein
MGGVHFEGVGFVPRQEKPLERDGTALVEFAADLRKLREEAGKPSYREMARRAHFSSTTLSDAAGGKRLPSLAVTVAFVRACGGDAAEWEQRWHLIAAESVVPVPVVPEKHEKGPYPGLSAYEVEDADRFFGRETLVATFCHAPKLPPSAVARSRRRTRRSTTSFSQPTGVRRAAIA